MTIHPTVSSIGPHREIPIMRLLVCPGVTCHSEGCIIELETPRTPYLDRLDSSIVASKKLNGDNYEAWKSNLNTILVVDDLRFVLIEECPQSAVLNANRANRKAYDRWIKVNEKARVYILANMSDILAKKHESLATDKEIMDSLKGMFGQPEWFLRHEPIKYIYTKHMKEGTSVREHVLDMMMHFNIAEVNGGAIDEANQVSFILKSLPKSFIPFQTNASLNKIEFNLTIHLNELQRFQNLTKGKGKEVEANVATTKGKFKRGSSSKSKIGPLKSNRKIEKKGKGKTPKQNKGKKTTEKDRPSSSTKVVDKTRNIGQTHPSQELGELRRSRRVVRQPDRYLGLSEAQIIIPDNGIEDPLTFKEAMNDVDSEQWIKAMDLEMESMYSNYVWILVDQPNDIRPIGCKWIYKRKQDQVGKVQTFKA
ncbi:gag/pol protein [Cucumis melo var. makuwa]|uniref:Gag/pol protein n=1 Tax=Cucumis melo var. makuwa TaxID=1194695 RepID=A0A5D3DQ34_CUCMM|nr:gag/pol protein [Cucumis melo var. makuwa]TYK25777.1 gag/pol protein [Cucumis melo var. makuwa]